MHDSHSCVVAGSQLHLITDQLTTGLFWFVTALIGVTGVGVISIMINHNRVLEYFVSAK